MRHRGNKIRLDEPTNEWTNKQLWHTDTQKTQVFVDNVG